MRLIVKKNGRKISELRFTAGPVYIGRHVNSQVLLPDRSVSRQHAVIFTTQDGKWMVDDLDSANKTYLNDKQVRKAEIKTGDVLKIVNFSIKIELEDSDKADKDKDIHLEDTLITTVRRPQIIVRKADVEHAPDIKLPAKRAKDFLEATEAICKADSPEELLKAMLSITLKQFAAFHSWCALRDEPEGPMTYYAGRRSDGKNVELNQIKLGEKITQAVEKGQFLLLPQAASQTGRDKIGSAMIAPIIDPSGCFGVVYVDNAMNQPCYSLSDLDYLMLVAIHTAAILENF
jgi:pSer/pThr/pTyr-binding forkhead associated (FHA) protein